jgi:hypothetical protein
MRLEASITQGCDARSMAIFMMSAAVQNGGINVIRSSASNIEIRLL